MKSAVLLENCVNWKIVVRCCSFFFCVFLAIQLSIWFFVCIVTIKYDDWVWDDECAYHFEDDKSFSEA